jgi:hypothetical protein
MNAEALILLMPGVRDIGPHLTVVDRAAVSLVMIA